MKNVILRKTYRVAQVYPDFFLPPEALDEENKVKLRGPKSAYRTTPAAGLYRDVKVIIKTDAHACHCQKVIV